MALVWNPFAMCSPKENRDTEYSIGIVPKEEVTRMAYGTAEDAQDRKKTTIEYKEETLPDNYAFDLNQYGKTWRVWYGDPLPEQMMAMPWEE